MSLPELSLAQAVRQQYALTMRTLGLSFYRNLIWLEILFSLPILWFSTTTGTFINNLYHLRVRYLSGSQTLWVAIVYVAAIAWIMADDRQRNVAFTFVTNRLSHNLSNLAALMTISAIAAVLGTLSMILTRVAVTLVGNSIVFAEGYQLTPPDLFYCLTAVFGYSLLAAVIVYSLVIVLRRAARLLALIPLVMLLGIKVPLADEAAGRHLNFLRG